MKKNVNRMYKIKDDKLLVLAAVARDYYIQYKMFFNSFNKVMFTEEYQDSVLGVKISEANATMSDAFIVKTQAKETADVEKAKMALLRLLKILRLIVKDRFDNKTEVLNEFLLANLSTIAQNADSLIAFTKDALVRVDKYKTELMESGLDDTLLTNINNALEDLDSQRREQVEVIRSRPGITQDRINKMNALWKELVKLNESAEVIFEENPEVRVLFDLPKAPKSGSSTEEEEQVEDTDQSEDVVDE